MFFEYGDQPGQYGHRALKLGMLRVVYSRRHDGYPPALRLSWGKGAGYVERFGWPAIRRAERAPASSCAGSPCASASAAI
jgi:hypothetical protein